MHKIEKKQILVSVLAPILIIILLVVTNLLANANYKPSVDFVYTIETPINQLNSNSNEPIDVYSDNYSTGTNQQNIIGDGHYLVRNKHIAQYCKLASSDYSDSYNEHKATLPEPTSCPQTNNIQNLYIYHPLTKTSQPITYNQAKNLTLNSKENFKHNSFDTNYPGPKYTFQTKLCNNDICKEIKLNSPQKNESNDPEYNSEFLGWIER